MLADCHELQSLRSHRIRQIRHVKQRYPVPSSDQFAPERSERMQVAGNGWANYSEVHVSGRAGVPHSSPP
jgi:hypothetical protein